MGVGGADESEASEVEVKGKRGRKPVRAHITLSPARFRACLLAPNMGGPRGVPDLGGWADDLQADVRLIRSLDRLGWLAQAKSDSDSDADVVITGEGGRQSKGQDHPPSRSGPALPPSKGSACGERAARL
jgi:hypothetical protein